MLLLLLKDSHKLLGLLRFEVLENLKEKHKKNFYNRANNRKQKQTSQRRILKAQKNRTERKEKVTKDYNLPTPRALARHILPRLAMGISRERTIDRSKYPHGILRKDRHLVI